MMLFLYCVISGAIITGFVASAQTDSATERDQNEQGDIHQNGNVVILNKRETTAPPWPHPRNDEMIFILPKQLGESDNIIIEGTLKQPSERLVVSFLGADSSNAPDYENIAYELLISFTETPNGIIGTVKNEEDGNQTQFNLGQQYVFQLEFNFRDDVRVILPNEVIRSTLGMDKRDIRFMILDGDVDRMNKLSFVFRT